MQMVSEAASESKSQYLLPPSNLVSLALSGPSRLHPGNMLPKMACLKVSLRVECRQGLLF